jgi:hypothetical protein
VKVSRNTAKVSSKGKKVAATTDIRANSYKWRFIEGGNTIRVLIQVCVVDYLKP